MNRQRQVGVTNCGHRTNVRTPIDIDNITARRYIDYEINNILEDCIHNPKRYLEEA